MLLNLDFWSTYSNPDGQVSSRTRSQPFEIMLNSLSSSRKTPYQRNTYSTPFFCFRYYSINNNSKAHIRRDLPSVLTIDVSCLLAVMRLQPATTAFQQWTTTDYTIRRCDNVCTPFGVSVTSAYYDAHERVTMNGVVQVTAVMAEIVRETC